MNSNDVERLEEWMALYEETVGQPGLITLIWTAAHEALASGVASRVDDVLMAVDEFIILHGCHRRERLRKGTAEGLH